MDRRRAIACVTTLVMGGSGWVRAQSVPVPIKERVADAERAFAATMARRDREAFATYISEEAVFLGDGGATVLRGRRAVVERWAKFFDGPAAPFSWAPDLVEALDSGTLALSSGPVRNTAGTVVGRFNSIWRLEPDGRWRVVFDRGCPVCRQ